MNESFCKPVSGEKTNLNSRMTLVTPPVEHFLSPYESIKGVRSHYCYYIINYLKWILKIELQSHEA